ncbi:PH domain-containing protein [Ornithinimicrobium cerasi]|uniref:PH domain-containing protein n=1 Tax=Ornithinimicrobium cerasi TaxID=2248773 RepID=UPI000EFF2F93|nr:PH domain-containing protein [Ornithinimicrobium cerasi]
MTPTTSRRPYDTFRPVTGAWVARAMALASAVVFVLVAALSPMPLGTDPTMSLVSRVAIALIGLVGAAFLWRYAVIRAEPSTEGLRVVNLVRTHDLAWEQIVRVGFSGGDPWAVLELTDTEEVAVMAIQRADGERARREAARLAALVQHHHRPSGGQDD